MPLESYNLDKEAHDLVLAYRDKKDASSQAYKMRMTVAYGLERFWGEQLRLSGEEANYWRDTWETLHGILDMAGIELPNDDVSSENTQDIKAMAEKLWEFDIKQRKIALSILTQLCDSLVWWTQRYKKKKKS